MPPSKSSNTVSQSTQEWLNQLSLHELETNTDAVFARLRRESPMAYIPAINAWVASTWALCSEIAHNAELFVGGTSPVHERVFGTQHVLGAEGDEHRRLRQTIDPALRPRAFSARLETHVRPAAKAQIEHLREQGSAELMADYFEPISVRSVGDVLGFTEVSADTLRRWFHGLSSGIANLGMDEEGNFLNPAGFAAADTAIAEIRTVVDALAGSSNPKDEGVVSHWLYDGMPEGQTRPLDDLMPSLHVLLLGGLQEPGHACGSTFLGLNTRPDLLTRVRDETQLISKAIIEGLRWISPIFSGTSRLAADDNTITGGDFEGMQTVWLAYGSANRDETEFDDPDSYDLDRAAHRHLAFGLGRHVCSGAAFAPQVARIALEELFAAFPAVRLDPDHETDVWGWIFRGPRELAAIW